MTEQVSHDSLSTIKHMKTNEHRTSTEEISSHVSLRKRTFPSSTFVLEFSALVTVCMISMVLVSAFREDLTNLRSVVQIVYAYVYLASIFWMSWCMLDIIRFRRHWTKYMATVHNEFDDADVATYYPHNLSYFPDTYNTGGLFMRVGAGLLCMGSLLLTVIELARTVEILRLDFIENISNEIHYSRTVYITKTVTFIYRFLFHCIQFTFLFRYGNIIINRHHFIAKIGLIHLIVANFCTWLEAIVIETLEEIHRYSGITAKAASISTSNLNITTDILDSIQSIQQTFNVYLYPCLIEYSLISVTVFYIICRNIGKKQHCPINSFQTRHIFIVNCSRASCGLLFGGIIFLLTISSLVPVYILEPPISTLITRITELFLLIVSFVVVCLSFSATTRLYYDDKAYVDVFDQILILVTTIGGFAYSFFSLFASIFVDETKILDIIIGILSLGETVLQSTFLLDTLKRRTVTKTERRNKPGRELITALLLINLAIWLHDSLSAKKVKLSPLQSEFYNMNTWSIVHAFTAPLAIFYRFHSSVCLADIWHGVYHDIVN